MHTNFQFDESRDESNQHRTAPNTNADAALFEAARRRLETRANARPTTPAGPKDPRAVANMTGAGNPIRRYLSSRDAREESVSGYRRKLRQVQRALVEVGMLVPDPDAPSEEFPWHCVTPAIAAAFAELVATRYAQSAKSRENHIGVLRKVVACCTRAGLISLEEREAILDCLPLRGGAPARTGSEITVDELVRLMRGDVRQDARGLRDSALLEVFAATGARSCEVVDLDVSDWDAVDRVLTIRRQKGGRLRTVPLHDGARDALVCWLEARGEQPGALFSTYPGKGGGARMSVGYVNDLIADRCAEVGITRRITTHDFRRTMITRLLRSGVDPFQVARCIDHKNVATTMRYDRRTQEEDDAVFRRLELPAGPDEADGA